MKKLLTLLALVALLLPSCQKINDRLDAIDERLDQIEGTQIASLQQQVDAINATLPQLKQADEELKGYIQSLQASAESLEQQIEDNDADIAELEVALNKAIEEAEASNDALKEELVAQLNAAKADVLAQLQATKVELETELTQINSTIATLQAKDAELEQKIADLETYVNTELQNTEDWAEATFATLEQYNAISEEIATTKQSIESLNTSLAELEQRVNIKIATDIAAAVSNLDATIQTKVTEITEAYTAAISTAKTEITEAYTAAIATAISNLETSMKQWVNEQLTGYYTIAETDAKLESLEQSIDDLNESLSDEINTLSGRVDAMKSELTDAYQKAITAAIETNNGAINTMIANEISTVNSRIDSEVEVINKRIDSLEDRIEAMEDIINKIQALNIVFDNTEGLVCYPGASVEVGYTIVGGDDNTEIEGFGDGGWSASVLKESDTTGKIRIKSPDGATNGKVIVLATSGVGGSVIKSLHFDAGILIDIMDSYEVDYEACTLNIALQTNLDYIVNIPAEAQSWISVADTRAELHIETLSFSILENLVAEPRSTTIEILNECGDVIRSFVINQKPQSVIEFADPIVKQACVSKFDTNGDAELSYKEANAVVTLGSDFFGDDRERIKSFDELQYFNGLKSIGYQSFKNCNNLASIIIPKGVTEIGYEAFYGCSSLLNIVLPDSVVIVDGFAFAGCIRLVNVSLGNNITSINNGAFQNCSSMVDIIIPNSCVYLGTYVFSNCSSFRTIVIPGHITSIEDGAFYKCAHLNSVVIENGVQNIGFQAFRECNSLTTIIIPDSVQYIGGRAFFNCVSLNQIAIGNGVTTIGENAFHSCFQLERVFIQADVSTMYSGILSNCSELKEVYINASNPPYAVGGSTWELAANYKSEIYVPMESVDAYKTAEGWSAYADYIVGYNFE